MTSLPHQLAQAKRQLEMAKSRFDNLSMSYDQPPSEVRKANEVYITQMAIVETIKKALGFEEAAREWKEEKS